MNGNANTVVAPDNAAAIAHINLLQGIINRLATNSASCKTWCLTLVSALLSFAGSTHNTAAVTVALVPVVALGFLDTRYLSQERAYRKLYDTIVGKLRDGSYRLADDAFAAKATTTYGGTFGAFWSWSVWPIYLGLVIAYLVAWGTGALVWLTK